MLTIDRIGDRGDGIAMRDGRPVYVPFTVAGDSVRARIDGRRGGGQVATPLEIITPGPGRRTPACRHFGHCGGCSLQHLDDDRYRAWKRDRVIRALARHRLADVPVAPLIEARPGDRRRATLKARRTAVGVVLGFNERRRHRIVDLRECPVLRPDLAALIPAIRDLLERILNPAEEADIRLATIDGGIDLAIAARREPDLAARERLAAFADAGDLARLSWQSGDASPEPVAARRACTIAFAGVPVPVPAGAFLQASSAGEAALSRLVIAAVDGAARVVDLFAGLGTISFPMARQAQVLAVDNDGAALDALQSAARQAGLAGRITVAARNLNRDPLSTAEMAEFDAVVFDPPRSGAAAQAGQLARAAVPVIAGVSCNPDSFARDAAILVAGGYRLDEVTPVDQFLWSEHVELVGVFRRT